jgi:AraC family transcriptional activator of pobA
MSKELHHIKTISQYHKIRGLDRPLHPLISIVDYKQLRVSEEDNSKSWTYGFYLIALKRNSDSFLKMLYGHQQYDYDDGVMFFIAPDQLFSFEVHEQNAVVKSGWMLLVHPDFLFGTMLAKNIKKYEYFRYSINEALFLSAREEDVLNKIVENIEQEYQSNIDIHSQQIIVSQIETLLAYSQRFYERQFITRKEMHHQVLDKLEDILDQYFTAENSLQNGLPSVKNIAEQLNITPNYLSSLLRHMTGQTTQQHIHNRLVEKAKEKLSITNLSISEIAYELGFDYPQSFSKLFKSKTNLSPVEYRNLFNKN